MDARALEMLVAVADRGSFSEAARALRVTQPAVSLAVKGLEERLGVKLLDRGGRRVRPTDAGEEVIARARRLFALEREIEEVARAHSQSLVGTLRVGASTGPGSRLLPRLVVAFRRANPEVAVSLEIHSTEEVIARVHDRLLALGVVGAEGPRRGLTYELFAEDEIVLAVPADHPLAGRTDVTLDELRAEPHVLQQPGSGVRAIVEDRLRDAGLRLSDLDVVAELGLQESAVTAVEQGLGVTFTSRDSIAREAALGLIAEARVAGMEARRPYLVVRRSGEAPRLVAAFLELCRQELAAEAQPGAAAGR